MRYLLFGVNQNDPTRGGLMDLIGVFDNKHDLKILIEDMVFEEQFNIEVFDKKTDESIFMGRILYYYDEENNGMTVKEFVTYKIMENLEK